VDAQAYLAEAGARVDRYLDEALPRADEPPAALHAAMRHLLFPGGKRLRPALAFAAAEAAGAPPERALPVAGAVELIHTYSLVHDDLPCMDDDDERRGQPTVHVAFGEATAVLAGDALQAAAFGLLAAAPDALVPGVLADLAEAASSRELVGGQSDDLAAGADAEPRAIEDVQRRKTGALFAAAVVGGARLAGAGPELLGRLRRFGEALGVAFQIADDLLDAGGRDAGASLVARIGPEAARARGEAHLARALAEVEGLGARAEPLRELARFAARRDR
jgi:geranylgeranyl pyrophosphate synthase